MLPSKTTVLFLIKSPSIVFDQGASAVWKEDRLAAENQLFQEDNFLFEYFTNKPIAELELFENFQPSYHPKSHDPFIFDINSIKDIDTGFEMFASDRTRKCSISDILDVLNEDTNNISKNSRDEGYDSAQADSVKSSIGCVSSDESFSSEESVDRKSKNELLLTAKRTIKENGIDASNSTHMKSNFSKPTHRSNDISFGDPTSALLNSDKDAVIVMMDDQNQVKYLSTSREKLQNFLIQENSTIITEIQSDKNSRQTCDKSNKISEISAENQKKRGRKRIYECSDECEWEDSKRIRNNEACRKFRKTKTEKLKHLFENETKLRKQNLRLKEQISSLECQLNYLKNKMNKDKNSLMD